MAAGERYLIFWENVSPEVTRVLLNRKLFGYFRKGKRYPGLIKKLPGCARLGKGCISAPKEHLKTILEVFNSLNVHFTVRLVVDIGEIAKI